MKSTVLVFVCAYLPGYKAGGPIQSIANLMTSLGEEIEFRIVTLDRDLNETQPYAGIQTGVWNQVGLAKVIYLSPESLNFRAIYRLLAEEKADCLYLNSFFGRAFLNPSDAGAKPWSPGTTSGDSGSPRRVLARCATNPFSS